MEGGLVIFFIGKFPPIFYLKQNDFDLCKGFFHGYKKKDPNSPDFHKKRRFKSPDFYDKFQEVAKSIYKDPFFKKLLYMVHK